MEQGKQRASGMDRLRLSKARSQLLRMGAGGAGAIGQQGDAHGTADARNIDSGVAR